MPIQYLAGKCDHCHNGILRMIRSTLEISEEKVFANYECMNPKCNNILKMVLYDHNRDEFYKDWQKDVTDQFIYDNYPY